MSLFEKQKPTLLKMDFNVVNLSQFKNYILSDVEIEKSLHNKTVECFKRETLEKHLNDSIDITNLVKLEKLKGDNILHYIIYLSKIFKCSDIIINNKIFTNILLYSKDSIFKKLEEPEKVFDLFYCYNIMGFDFYISPFEGLYLSEKIDFGELDIKNIEKNSDKLKQIVEYPDFIKTKSYFINLKNE